MVIEIYWNEMTVLHYNRLRLYTVENQLGAKPRRTIIPGGEVPFPGGASPQSLVEFF